MPCVISQNKYSVSIFLFQAVKLWAKACVCVALSVFLVICIPFLILVILPFFTAFLWALFLCKILCFFRLCPQFRFLEMKILLNYLSCTASTLIGRSSSSKSNSNWSTDNLDYEIVNINNELIAKALDDKQESVELDPLELPCLYESDFDIEEDNHREIKGKKGVKEGMGQICTYEEGSWQVLVSKPHKRREPESFYDVLSFWKSKEKGEEP